MQPAEPLTEARIHSLPPVEQAPWLAYLARSHAQMAQDKAALAAERKDLPAVPEPPQAAHHESGMPLKKGAAWYGTPEARHVADNIVSFQTPAGGWGKNVDRSELVRKRGQGYVAGENGWSWVGTIDNDATTTELRFLARVQAQLPGADGHAYRDALAKGVRYLLHAQYPNGGFPQIYPLAGGYHDAVTFNDDAMLNVVALLRDIGGRQGDFASVPTDLADAAREAADRSIKLILQAQVTAGEAPAGWAQQYDTLSLAPAGARNFEPIALSTAESARLLEFLMGLREPSPEVVRAVHAGVAWLERVALHDLEWTASPGKQHVLVAMAGAGPTWSRYYDIASMKPIFGDRDRSIHDDVNDLSPERRNGYGWYGTWPEKALERYAAWSRAHPQPTT